MYTGDAPAACTMDDLKHQFPGSHVTYEGGWVKVHTDEFVLCIRRHAFKYRMHCVQSMMAHPVEAPEGYGIVREMQDRKLRCVIATQFTGRYGPCVVAEFDHNGTFIGSSIKTVVP